MPKTTTPLITVKTKYQVTLPTVVRRAAGVEVGDMLEARVEGKKITLTPKGLIDRELALALEDVRKGRTVGPFNTVEEMLKHLHKQVRQYQGKKKRAKSA